MELRLRSSGEPVAFLQDLIDFVLVPLAESRWPAEAQGRFSLRMAILDGRVTPARIALRLARDVSKCRHYGEEPATQMPGIDGAVVDFFYDNWRRGRKLWPGDQKEDLTLRTGGNVQV